MFIPKPEYAEPKINVNFPTRGYPKVEGEAWNQYPGIGSTFLPPVSRAPESTTYVGPLPVLQEGKLVGGLDVEKLRAETEYVRKFLNEYDSTRKAEEEAKKKQEEDQRKKVQPLKTLRFKMGAPFVLLPALSGVEEPMWVGTPNSFKVAVASRDWFHALDQMRAAGWEYYHEWGIEMFLLKSAWIVKQELNYNCISVRVKPGTISYPGVTSVSPAPAVVSTPFGVGTTTPGYVPSLPSYTTTTSVPYTTTTSSSYGESFIPLNFDAYNENFELFKKDILSRRFEYVNRVEQFCMYYPDNSRQGERLQKGYSQLITDIRTKLGPYAFLPSNYDESPPPGTGIELRGSFGKEGVGASPMCPPRNVDFFIDDLEVKNFLRNWSMVDTNSPTYVQGAYGVKKVYQCKPPNEDQYSWIPVEYRKDVEEKYNIVQFRYNSGEFQRYLYTLLKIEDLESGVRSYDSEGRPFITVQGEDGIGYRLYLAALNLSYPLHERRMGIPDGEMTLREWLEDYVNDLSLAPLIQAILNVPAPANRGTPQNPGIYDRYIYEVHHKDGSILHRMYADAPVRAFRHQLIRAVVVRARPGEQYSDCKERFIQGVYAYIYWSWYKVIDNFPTEVPQRYRDILTMFFNYGDGGEKECLTSISRLSSLTPSSPVVDLTTAKFPSKSELEKESESETLARISDILNVAKLLSTGQSTSGEY